MASIANLTKEEEDLIKETFEDYQSGDYIRVLPLNFVTSRKTDVQGVKDFKIHPDDVWIVTPPKCGTTWTQEIVWLMKNNVDLEGAKLSQFYRVPYLEIGTEYDVIPYPEGKEKNAENLKAYMENSVEYASKMDRPRIIKSHFPLSSLPDGLLDTCKVIFVTRNIKDMVVSFYHHKKKMEENGIASKGFPAYANLFRRGLATCTPMMEMVLEAWQQRDHPNLHFMTFEDMKADIDSCLSGLSAFLGVSLTPEQTETVKTAVSFQSMKNNAAVNKKGEFGGRDGWIRPGGNGNPEDCA